MDEVPVTQARGPESVSSVLMSKTQVQLCELSTGETDWRQISRASWPAYPVHPRVPGSTRDPVSGNKEKSDRGGQ